MSGRYAAVPQHDQEVMILEPITNSHYNFNSGLPNSMPPSVAPSYTPSSPNSPPPSFYTHSTPGTPRATPSSNAASLWGVAPSLSLSSTTETHPASSVSPQIQLLQDRITRLEESLGKLLLEKESWKEHEDGGRKKSNCCVVFGPSAGEELERGADNCCVSFRGKRIEDRDREKRRFILAVLVILAVMLVGVVGFGRRGVEGNGAEGSN